MTDFRKCRYWTRGWCLQEVIAPSEVMFFDKEWLLIGSKAELKEEIEAITSIDRWVLTCSTPLSSISIAKRMSWAAARNTTLTEDMAYCLLGIFDVNMPLLYGEGPKAFVRLQEEILKKTTDLSLFAWLANEHTLFRGGLAESPAEFRSCGKICAERRSVPVQR